MQSYISIGNYRGIELAMLCYEYQWRLAPPCMLNTVLLTSCGQLMDSVRSILWFCFQYAALIELKWQLPFVAWLTKPDSLQTAKKKCSNTLTLLRAQVTCLLLRLHLGLLALLHLHRVLAPILLETSAVGRLRCIRVHALGPAGRLSCLGLTTFPPRKETLQLDIELAQLFVRGRRRHDCGPWLNGLPRLGNLLGILSKVGEIGLQATNVAGRVSRGACTVILARLTRYTLSRAVVCPPQTRLSGLPCLESAALLTH